MTHASNGSTTKPGPTLSAWLKVSYGSKSSFRLDARIDVPPGVTVLFGPSGSGKSTILRCIAGIVRPDSGFVRLGDETWFDGESGVLLPIHERRVGYVFQSLALFPHMTARENVTYGVPKGEVDRDARAAEALTKFRAGHLTDRKPASFSGGEAQRVALARALAMRPRCVLLDEPFSAMDRELRIEFAEYVRTLAAELHVPIVHVTHHRKEAIAIASRVLFVENGTVVREGTADDLASESPLASPSARG